MSWTRMDSSPPGTPPRRLPPKESYGFATDVTGGSRWRAGWMPSTAAWCVRSSSNSPPAGGDHRLGCPAHRAWYRHAGLWPAISAATARRLACDCKPLPAVLGGDSEPLDIGRAQRTVPLGIRRALVARDGGCTFPGCGRPPGLCDGHHAAHWADGGVTSVGNCCLLCPHHHQQVHL
jgi:hypothetical protein